MKRYLVHGPCLSDPGELLFFDAWIWPFTKAYIRPKTLGLGYVGHPVQELWPQNVLEALERAGLAVSPSNLLFSERADSEPGDFTTSMQARVAEAVALASESMLITLDTPAAKAQTAAWLSQLDRAGRQVATRLCKRGHLVTSKQFADVITRVFKPGWDIALALVLPAFPLIDRAIGKLEALQAFLADPSTRARREALYEWPSLLGRPGLSLQAVAKRVADAAADYATWVEASGLASGRGPVELLWKTDDPQQAEALAAAPLSDAARGVAHLQTRGLAEGETADSRKDTPMVLVCHRPRGYPKF